MKKKIVSGKLLSMNEIKNLNEIICNLEKKFF